LGQTVADVEKEMIVEALRQANGSHSVAAEMLDVNRRLLTTKMKDYGIES